MRRFLTWCLVAASAHATSLAATVVQDGSLLPRMGRRAVEKDATVTVRIALTQRNLDRGYGHVMDVSDPASMNYGKHWSKEEVLKEFAPSDESVDAVFEFLRQAGVGQPRTDANAGWLAIQSMVGSLEQLFNTTLFEIPSRRNSATRLACDSYSIPAHLEDHIDYITIARSPSQPQEHQSRPTAALQPRAIDWQGPPHHFPPGWNDLAHCGRNITPPCIRALYDIPYPHGSPQSLDLGIFEFDSAYAQEDLDLYYKTYAPEIPAGTLPKIVSINGAVAPAAPGTASAEANLDVTMAYAVLGNANLTFYDARAPPNASYSLDTAVDALLDAVDQSFCSDSEKEQGYECGTTTLPSVLSISYGEPELFSNTKAVQERICNEFMKLTLQGHTILVSSGDYGVAGPPIYGDELDLNNGCIPEDYHNEYDYLAFNGTIFSPNFPATCPYVLSVGATMLQPNQTFRDPESAMELPGVGFASANSHVVFGSSGGFANYFPRPSYQDNAISTYLAQHNPGYKSYVSNGDDIMTNTTNIGTSGGIYNRAGRGIPDVSANGVHFSTFVNGQAASQDGTSAATPLWGSIIALINQRRAEIGKGPVGFVNPVLYTHLEVFHDIRNGSNPGCGTEGFPAVEGWDPNTGLGTPDFPRLLEVFMGLP